MRTDSFGNSVWTPGSILTGTVSDGATLFSFTVPYTGFYLLGFLNSCDVAFTYKARQVDTDGATVLREIQFVAAAGNDPQFFPSPTHLFINQFIKVILNGAITTTKGVQISLWTTLLAQGPPT